jgi:hypothetical protein
MQIGKLAVSRIKDLSSSVIKKRGVDKDSEIV